MEAATVVEQEEGAPVEQGAEATRSAEHLFAYSARINVGADAERCEQRDGGCTNPDHFHAWICLPNPLQRQDIIDKARAARARRRRALRDPEADAYSVLESELDDLLAQEREPLLQEIAEREARKTGVERVRDLIESDERFTDYWQDMEELARLTEMPEEERPTEEFESLTKLSDDFDAVLEEQRDQAIKTELEHLRSKSEDELRDLCRDVRIDGEGREAHERTYYLWMGFICTKTPLKGGSSKRVFPELKDYREASPEVVRAIDSTLHDLEGRLARGEAPGNS